MDGSTPKGVFDEDFVSGLCDPRPHVRDPWPVMICKGSEPRWAKTRQQIETWYAELPQEHRPRYHSRLRQLKGSDFESALAELYVHHWLRSNLSPVTLELEPWEDQGEGNPDFVVELPGSINLVVEVYSPNSLDPQFDGAEEYWVERSTKKWPSMQVVWRSLPAPPASREEVDELVRVLEVSLRCLNLSVNHVLELEFSGKTACLEVLPPGGLLPFASWRWPRVWCTTAGMDALLRKRVEPKAGPLKKHSNLPVVLLAVDRTELCIGEDDWLDLCYGPERYTVSVPAHPGDTCHCSTIPRSGGLFLRPGRCTYISALVGARPLFGDEGYGLGLTGFANPFAVQPVPRVLVNAMPFWTTDATKPGYLVRMLGEPT